MATNQQTDVKGAWIYAIIIAVLSIAANLLFLGKTSQSPVVYSLDAVLCLGVLYGSAKAISDAYKGGADLITFIIGAISCMAIFVWLWSQSSYNI